MASSRPRPQDPVNGGWSDVALSRPSSPPPAYSSPPTVPVDVEVGTMNTVDALLFVPSDTEEGWLQDDDSISSDVIVEFNNLNEQLRRQRAPVVKPMPVPDEPFPFMKLPQELREQIYDDYFSAEDRLETYDLGDETTAFYNFEFSLLRVSKQIYLEALRSWKKNIFVRIETPWPHAVHHIRSDGDVPIVAHGTQADTFTHYTALVQITAPLHGVTDPDHNIILHINDLPKFTSVWYYSALNYQNLNPQIHLTFTLCSPFPVPLPLQKRLLLPFGAVKDLHATSFTSFSAPAISELRALMAIPYPTVQQSCDLATTRLEQGDAYLSASNPSAALAAYISAFDAIHIKVFGRARRILADGHFADDIPSGRYAGQPGMTVRVVLRIKLVARVVHAYMRLDEPAEAAFWGVRTVKLLRQGATQDTDGLEAFFAERIGERDMGGLYARTAVALEKIVREERWVGEREMYGEVGVGKELDTGALWRRAGGYLRGEKWEGERRGLGEECGGWGVRVPEGWVEG